MKLFTFITVEGDTYMSTIGRNAGDISIPDKPEFHHYFDRDLNQWICDIPTLKRDAAEYLDSNLLKLFELNASKLDTMEQLYLDKLHQEIEVLKMDDELQPSELLIQFSNMYNLSIPDTIALIDAKYTELRDNDLKLLQLQIDVRDRISSISTCEDYIRLLDDMNSLYFTELN